MPNDRKYALQNGTYGAIHSVCIDSAHFQGLDLLNRFCQANAMPEEARVFFECSELLAAGAPEFTSVSNAMREDYFGESTRNTSGFDDRKEAIASAAQSLRIPEESFASVICGSRQGAIRLYSFMDFRPPFVEKAGSIRAEESILRRAVFAASALSRLRELLPQLAEALQDMRDAPLDWGKEAAFAMAMADRLVLLAPEFPAALDEAIEFLNPSEIMSGVHQPWYSVIADDRHGSVRLLSEDSRGGKPFTLELARSRRFANLADAKKIARKNGLSSYAVVEFTCAARHARPYDESGVSYSTLEEAKLACSHGDAAFDKLAIERAIDGLPPFESALPGIHLGLAAGAIGGLIAAKGGNFYSPFKALMGRDAPSLAGRFSRRKPPLGMILIDYELCSARIVSKSRLRSTSPLMKLGGTSLASSEIAARPSLGSKRI